MAFRGKENLLGILIKTIPNLLGGDLEERGHTSTSLKPLLGSPLLKPLHRGLIRLSLQKRLREELSTVLVQVPRGLLPLKFGRIFVTNLTSIEKIGLRAQTGTSLHSFYGWKEEERCVGSRKELVLKGYAKTHTSAVKCISECWRWRSVSYPLGWSPSDHYPGFNGDHARIFVPDH